MDVTQWPSWTLNPLINTFLLIYTACQETVTLLHIVEHLVSYPIIFPSNYRKSFTVIIDGLLFLFVSRENPQKGVKPMIPCSFKREIIQRRLFPEVWRVLKKHLPTLLDKSFSNTEHSYIWAHIPNGVFGVTVINLVPAASALNVIIQLVLRTDTRLLMTGFLFLPTMAGLWESLDMNRGLYGGRNNGLGFILDGSFRGRKNSSDSQVTEPPVDVDNFLSNTINLAIQWSHQVF